MRYATSIRPPFFKQSVMPVARNCGSRFRFRCRPPPPGGAPSATHPRASDSFRRSGSLSRLLLEPLQQLNVVHDVDPALAAKRDNVRRIEIAIHGAQDICASVDGGIDDGVIRGIGEDDRSVTTGSTNSAMSRPNPQGDRAFPYSLKCKFTISPLRTDRGCLARHVLLERSQAECEDGK
jgi:hypothetical protein